MTKAMSMSAFLLLAAPALHVAHNTFHFNPLLQFVVVFGYVNRCRLAHAEAYRKGHPEADADEIALLSGFNSRQSYYNARKKLRNG